MVMRDPCNDNANALHTIAAIPFVESEADGNNPRQPSQMLSWRLGRAFPETPMAAGKDRANPLSVNDKPGTRPGRQCTQASAAV